MFLIFLAWPFLEIYLFIKAIEVWGAFNVLMATLTGFFLGLLIVKAQGRSFMYKVQAELAQGKVPTASVINSALIFIGGVFILVPGFFSDFMGLLLVLPGTRHLISLYVRYYLARKISLGQFKVFTSGFGMGSQGFGQGENFTRDFGTERDVSQQVIDVKPISSTEERKKPE